MSFTLNYTGDEINAILARANNGGEIDDELALKAPLVSPALTGNPTAPTQPEEDSSTKVATTEYADRAADAAEAAAEAAAKEYTDAATGALYITDTASGSIASFSDGADGIPMRSVKASIEPVQDLHGYANPWPAGGNYNLLPCESASQTINGVAFTVNANGTITASRAATSSYWANFVLASALTLPAGSYKVYAGIATNDVMVTVRDGGASGTVLAQTSSNGAVATLVLSEEKTLYVSIDFRPSYSGTNIVVSPMIIAGTSTTEPFAPYSNECPISGWTGAEVVRTGKNLINPSTCVNGLLNATTGAVSPDSKWVTTDFIKVTGDSVVVSGWRKGTESCFCVRFVEYDENKNRIGSVNNLNIAADQYWTKTRALTTGTAYVRITFGFDNKIATPEAFFTANDVQLELGSTASPYEAFGSTYPVTWESQAGTVYGGTIDVVSGELRVTHKSILGTASNITRSGVNNWEISHSKVSDALVPSANVAIMSDRFSPVTATTVGGAFLNRYGAVRFTTADDYADVSTLIAAIGEPQFVYPLAQPVTYQLTPQQIVSLLGQNHVWSNTGDTEVKYVADPKLYIAKMLGGSTLTLGSVSPLSVNRPVAISEEDLEQAGEVSEAVEAAAETVLPAESGETEEEAQE